MKKTLVALAVAGFAATSAQAVTVYNNEGTTVDFGGRVDVMLGKFTKNERADLRNNGSRIELHAEHDLQNGLKALAHYRLRFNNGDDKWDSKQSFNNLTTDKLWLGLQHADVGTLTFGKQDTTGDAIQMNDHFYAFGGNNNVLSRGDKVISYRSADYQIAEGQTFGFGIDYVFGNAKKDNTDTGLKYGYGSTLFYAGKFGDVGTKVNAGYTVERLDNGKLNNATGAQRHAWRVATQFDFQGFTFGAEYGQTKFKKVEGAEGRGRFIEVTGRYELTEQSAVYAGWERNQYKGDVLGLSFDKGDATFLSTIHNEFAVANNQKLTENVYLVGADYKFNKNVVVYAEYAHARVKGTENAVANGQALKGETLKDNKYGVGLRVYF